MKETIVIDFQLLEKSPLTGADLIGKEIDLSALNASKLFLRPDLHRRLEELLKPLDVILVANADDSLSYQNRSEFLPEHGYLMHFNIATSKPTPHIEPLPAAHDTASTATLSMIEGQKQYVLEAEVSLVGVIESGVMRPMYVGTLIDFGDRTPRLDNTGRTYKTWTPGIEYGGSSGLSTTWVGVNSWEELNNVEMEYWVTDDKTGEVVLHTPNAQANSLKLWGQRLGDWVGNYPTEKLAKLGIVEGQPFLISTGQILLEDDGARSIDPAVMPEFTALSVMKIDSNRVVETIVKGVTSPRNEQTFLPTEAPLDGDYFTYYQKMKAEQAK